MSLSLKDIESAFKRGGNVGKILTALEEFKATPRGRELIAAANERLSMEKSRRAKSATDHAAELAKLRSEIADIDARLTFLEKPLIWPTNGGIN